MTLLVFRVERDAPVTEVVSAEHETTINSVGLCQSPGISSCVIVSLTVAASNNNAHFVRERGSKYDDVIHFLYQHLIL